MNIAKGPPITLQIFTTKQLQNYNENVAVDYISFYL